LDLIFLNNFLLLLLFISSKKMQKILKTFLLGLVFWLGFFIAWWIGYFLLRARQTTNPWITEQSPVGWLYVNPNEILTAAKRNTLTDKVNTKTFYVCTNADSSTPCAEAKSNGWQWTANYRAINCLYPTILAHGDAIQYNSWIWKFRDNTGAYYSCTDWSVVVMNLNK